MSKSKFRASCLLIALIFTLTSQSSLAAPPVNGQNDCGLIQGNTFYSDTYSPPNGTPATSGSCSWVRQSNNVCAVRNYDKTSYNLYPHTYICNMPFDDYVGILVGAVALLGFYSIRWSFLPALS